MNTLKVGKWEIVYSDRNGELMSVAYDGVDVPHVRSVNVEWAYNSTPLVSIMAVVR